LCAKKLTGSQLKLLLGTKEQKKIFKKLKTKPGCSEETV